MSTYTDNFEELDLKLHGVRLPNFEITNTQKQDVKISEDSNNFSFLRALCEKGMQDKNLKGKAYQERMEYELQTLEELGFTDYILLVWDVTNFCKRNKIAIGLGRGSAAGCLVLYLIGSTNIDPIKYELFFERFVSKVRAKKKVVNGVTYLDGSLMVDVDIDVCYHGRQEVLKYLNEKFSGKTSKVLTLTTLSSKLLIKECGKIIAEENEQEMNKVSAMIPKLFGSVKDISETYDEVEEFKEWVDSSEIRKETYKTALKIRNLVKNKGIHASAIAICYDNLEDSCPSELTSEDKDKSKSKSFAKKAVVSSYEMDFVSISNVKLDILGLRCVSVVDDVCNLIGIDKEDINLNDPFIYQNLQDLKNPHGLFQIEADTNYKVCQKVKPKNLEELSGVLALARPGALSYVDQYANYTNNGVEEAIHPFFDDILSYSGGVALYQEQLMKMAHKIGFTLDEAEILRRIVGKKKVSEVKKWKKKISEKIKQNNLDEKIGDVLWKVLEDSANYSFNKSHSIAYAALAAITIYLKFKYPKEFFLALLKMSRYESEPIKEISKINREMNDAGVKLLPPHLIKSEMDFSIEEEGIRFGLLSIKGVSDKSIEKLNKFKNKYSTKFQVFEAASKSGIGIGILSALIQAGTFEGFSQSRTTVVYEAQIWSILTKTEKTLVHKFAEKFDYDLVKTVKYLYSNYEIKNGKEKPYIKDSRKQTIKKKTEKYSLIYKQNKKSERFANWFYENQLLGYTYGVRLIDIWKNVTNNLVTINTVKNSPMDSRVKFIGFVDGKPYRGTSRNGNPYLRLEVSDENKQTKVMIFNDKMWNAIGKDARNVPKSGEIVIVKGVVKDECVFADEMYTQRKNSIYTKLSDLKDKNLNSLTNEKDIV
jgi:DNA polymerase-3 subunit alpha